MITPKQGISRTSIEFRLSFLYDYRHKLFWEIEDLQQLPNTSENSQRLIDLNALVQELEQDIDAYYQMQTSPAFPTYQVPSTVPIYHS